MNRSSLTYLVVILALLYVLAIQMQAQTSADSDQTNASSNQEPARIRVKTELMQIRAVVADRGGKLIDNLTEKDFLLSDDGAPQAIAFFSVSHVPVRSRVEAAEAHKAVPEGGVKPSIAAPGSPVDRSVVLLVDDLHISHDSMEAVRTALHRIVDEQLTDHDAVALKTTTGRLGVMEQFIHDRRVLRKGIDKILPWRISQESLFTPLLAGKILRNDGVALHLGVLVMEAEEGVLGIDQGVPEQREFREDPVTESLADKMVKVKARTILAEEQYQRLSMVSTVAAVVDKLAEMPGPRLIAFFSDGFTASGAGGEPAIPDLMPIISRAARSGVRIYTFNAKGLANPMITASMPGGAAVTTMGGDEHVAGQLMSMQNESELDLVRGLGVLGTETGGRFFNNTNDFVGGVKTMVEENLISYEIAYYPPPEKDPRRTRSIKVAVRGHPEYVVRAQKSYVLSDLRQANPEPDARTALGRLHQAMSRPLPVTNIQVDASAQTDKEPRRLEVWIKGADLNFRAEGEQSLLDLTVETVIFDSVGRMVKTTREPLKRPLTSDQIVRLREKDLQFVSRIDLKPGIYHVRIGVLDAASDRLGTAIVWLEIPKPRKKQAR